MAKHPNLWKISQADGEDLEDIRAEAVSNGLEIAKLSEQIQSCVSDEWKAYMQE